MVVLDATNSKVLNEISQTTGMNKKKTNIIAKKELINEECVVNGSYKSYSDKQPG